MSDALDKTKPLVKGEMHAFGTRMGLLYLIQNVFALNLGRWEILELCPFSCTWNVE